MFGAEASIAAFYLIQYAYLRVYYHGVTVVVDGSPEVIVIKPAKACPTYDLGLGVIALTLPR